MTQPVTLGFDTSGPWCAAAVLVGETVVACRSEDMARGQAERLMLLLEDVLTDAGLGWTDLQRIGVGIGPGNFTGIRISVSAARGLSMGLTIPAIGVDGFASRAACVPKGQPVGVPAPQDKIYVADPAPRLIQRAEKPDAITDVPPAELATAIARLAAQSEDTSPPAPLYVRAADAAPSRDGPPVMLD